MLNKDILEKILMAVDTPTYYLCLQVNSIFHFYKHSRLASEDLLDRKYGDKDITELAMNGDVEGVKYLLKQGKTLMPYSLLFTKDNRDDMFEIMKLLTDIYDNIKTNITYHKGSSQLRNSTDPMRHPSYITPSLINFLGTTNNTSSRRGAELYINCYIKRNNLVLPGRNIRLDNRLNKIIKPRDNSNTVRMTDMRKYLWRDNFI